MAKQPTITTLSSGYYSTELLNENFTAIQEQFDLFVSRNGDTPNTMLGDLDMNSNDILNVGQLDVATLIIDDTNVSVYVGDTGLASDINNITFTQGDILYYDGSNLVVLGIGTAGQVLKVNSGGTSIEWAEDIDTDTDEDTIGVTVEEDGVSRGDNFTILNFITDGAGAVSDAGNGQVDVNLSLV